MLRRSRDGVSPVAVRKALPKADVERFREAFAAAGGTIAANPAAAASTADIVVVAVVNAQQVETVLYGDGGATASLRKGGLIMQCATVPPA